MTDGSFEEPMGPTSPEESWVLVVPDGWAVAPVAAERLHEAARSAPEGVVALGAPISQPPSGVSGRVHAERSSMEVTSARRTSSVGSAVAVDSDPFRGAVLVRAGTEVTTSREGVRVDGGVVPVPGAVSHDPWVPVTELADAVPEGRPPFPSRPVVLVLALEDDLDQADAARGIVNGLLRNGVEGRLAVPEVTEGLLSAQPCAPTESTVRALRPEVVIVADEAARVAVEGWLERMDRVRGTVLVELTTDIAMDIELVSWRIGVAQGRLRARIGPRVGPKRLAALVNRLVSGPQPEPPSDVQGSGGASVTIARPRVRRQKRGRAVVLHPPTGPTRRSSALVEHLGSNGWSVDAGAISAASVLVDRASSAHLVIGDPDSMETLFGLVSPRGGTVVDLTTDHLCDGILTPVAEKSAVLAGAAVSASQLVLDAVRSLGVRAVRLPDLYPQDHLERFATARREAVRDGEAVIGWIFDGDQVVPEVTSAIARMVQGISDRNVRVEVVPDREGRIPDGLVRDDLVSVRSSHPDPDELASWWGQIWAPGPNAVVRTGDASVVVEAGAAGVPTVAPLRALGSAAALVDPANLVHEATRAGSWYEAVSPLLSGARFDIRTGVHDRVASLHGRKAAGIAVGRLASWIAYHEEDR